LPKYFFPPTLWLFRQKKPFQGGEDGISALHQDREDLL
jgi:hypothetical protein